MLTLISYDIVDDKRRTKVMQLLKGYGTRVQRSVFECHLDPAASARLDRALRQLIDPQTDSVRCYPLDAAALQRVTIHGLGQLTPDPAFYLV